MFLCNKNILKMSNFKGASFDTDLISTEYIEHDLPNFQSEKWQFPFPFLDGDSFNLFESPYKYQDISIYLSLNKEKESDSRFVKTDQKDFQDCTSVKKTRKVKKPQTIQKLKHVDQRKLETMGETKNIPKNFGKQLIKFVKKNRRYIEEMLDGMGSDVCYKEFNLELQTKKKKMNKIVHLQQLWLDKTIFGREMRIISYDFLRKFAYKWIFNSRIENYRYHLKYRSILMKVIKKPDQFVFLKTDC